MNGPRRAPGKAWGAWLFVYALFALCAVLGILQYRAIAEVSIAAHERLRSSLQASLVEVGQDVNSEISSAAAALEPDSYTDAGSAQSAFTARYEHAKSNARVRRMFARIAMAVPARNGPDLLAFEPASGAWKPIEWPAEWNGMRARFAATMNRLPLANARGSDQSRDREGAVLDSRGREHGRGPHPGEPRPHPAGTAFETPLFGPPSGPGPMGRHEIAWLIFDVNTAYLRDDILPEVLQRHLGADYQAVVVTRGEAREIVYRSDPDLSLDLAQSADGSIGIFDPQMEPSRRAGPTGKRGPGRGPGPEMGRWMLFVRHRAGSLEAVVAQARWRSMAVTAGVLLMVVAMLAALIRTTRRAQKLAGLQMEFVAGVSHELRTPLTVIHTAAYNLRGKVASNPAQVERYGALIQQESGRLKDLVEQVLRFAGANAGHAIQEREPLAVESVVEAAIDASKALMEGAGCVVEKRVEDGLPSVMGDPVALRHALENLLANAAKYGAGEGHWIGIAACRAGRAEQPEVEIRVADHGRGIPAEEQKHIFDPFFRGARAVQDQVHGTGLGLSLVQKIVEAHGGSIELRSEPMKGAEFIVRLPAMAGGAAG